MRTPSRLLPLVSALILAIFAGGCAYTTQSTLPEQYQTIFVAAFKDKSPQYDLQAPLSDAIIRKFITDGRLQVVQREHADLVLDGAILDYRMKGLTYDQDDNVTQFVVVVAAEAQLTDTQTGEVLWQEPLMAGETTYYTRAAGQSSDRMRGNAEVFLPTVRSFSTEEENRAASEALEQLASDIFYRTVEPW